MSSVGKNEILIKVSKGELSPHEALLQLKELSLQRKFREKDIAIIGVSAKLPGADTLEQFWENLKEGVNSITEIPSDRWDMQEFYHSAPEDCKGEKSYCNQGGFLKDVYSFDPTFFSLSSKEATLMDPQERLLLQSSWHTLEDAGITRNKLQDSYKKMGVYIGETTNNHLLFGPEQWERDNKIIPTTFPWSMANRISYFLDTNGPSLTIDTACSSSLVAIHQAIQALRNGAIPLALVGGVNLYLHPSKYIWLSTMRMVSPSGKSHSFGADADGFCPGEGVVTMLLKPALQAQRDKDKIYGIIKGTAINHDGKTTGYTVPNPQAQCLLIKEALKDAATLPSEISLIEAHGTGTKLGDPIEISGIKRAFSSVEVEQNCAISSVKSNIGHLEAAAGLVGLLKVLLQMKHKTKVPSLHCAPLNPVIDLQHSPLYIQDTLSLWDSPCGETRKAGISSFGAGGVNAHITVEEYQSNETDFDKTEKNYELFTLSAHCAESLLSLLSSYKELITESSSILYDLCAQTYCERTQLPLRMAFVIKSKEELRSYLTVYSASLKEVQSYLAANKNISAQAKPISADRKELLEYYCAQWRRREPVNLETFFPTKYKRIELPLYPFTKEVYRILQKPTLNANRIHPLLGRNCSTMDSIIFSTNFEGEEFFLIDHQVDQNYILPGVAYLEMVLQAIHHLTGEWYNNFTNIYWTAPFIFSPEHKSIEVTFTKLDEKIQFRVTSQEGTLEHATGFCSIVTDESEPNPIRKVPAQIELSRETIYAMFRDHKLHYGSSFRAVQKIQLLDSTVYGEVKLPNKQISNLPLYKIHPSLLDGILQTTLPLSNENGNTMLPFSIDELTLHTSFCKDVKVETKKILDQDTTKQFNLRATDTTGSPIVSIKGFTLKSFNPQSEKGDNSPISYIYPQWTPSSPAKRSHIPALFWLSGEQKGTLPDDSVSLNSIEELANALEDFEKKDKDKTCAIVIYYQLQECEEKLYQWLLRLVQCIQMHCSAPRHLLLYSEEESPLYSMSAGFLKCAVEETSNLAASLLYFIGTDPDTQLRLIQTEASNFYNFREIRYIKEERYSKKYLLHSYTPPPPLVYSDKTVLITGGLGALGRVFAKYTLKELNAKQVVLLGRSNPSQKEKILKDISPNPSRCIYVQGDITDYAFVKRVIDEHHITGIIHAAGITNDSLISQKSDTTECSERYRRVLAPKIEGTKQLLAATKDKSLDFLILCSSISSLTGNVGQSDYAMANAFMDAHAFEGHTPSLISINWPLWKEGGMQVDSAKEQFFESQWGMEALDTPNGLQALTYALSTKDRQLLPFQGNSQKLLQMLNHPEKLQKSSPSTPFKLSLKESVEAAILMMLSEITGYDKAYITPESSLEELGFDSLMITDLSNRLGKQYSLSLSAALFFEFTSAQEICTHLLSKYSGILSSHYGVSAEPMGKEKEKASDTNTFHRSHNDIAIIGMSSHFPQCKTLEEFWKLIATGQSAITQVPHWRWDTTVHRGKGIPPYGGFVDDIECFDPLFFNISPTEAKLMDPQQRLTLQTVWKTIEDGGYKASSLSGTKTGIYFGVSVNDYAELMERDSAEIQAHTSIGSVHSMLVNRISYFLNLTGPSEAIDTACSSSLVALHRAVQDIQTGNAEMAIVGGVNALLSPKLFESFHKAGMLSSDGKCRTCDKSANGYVRAEGAGAIFLKPLEKAIEDGDSIYATIKGTGVNHGGRAKSLTAPNPKAQRELLIDTYTRAKVPFHTVGYIELHGTGTPLGDPIEIHGLKSAEEILSADEQTNTPCFIGSVKTNIGHLESAAGIAGLIKTVVAMNNKKIPPMAHFESLNPEINLNNSSFTINNKMTEWLQQGVEPRRAGVSSFGFGGVNAHVILEERPQQQRYSQTTDNEELLIFSAQTKESLISLLHSFYTFLKRSLLCSEKQPQMELTALIEIISSVLELPQDEVDLNLSPLELGIDPVAANTIITLLNRKLKTNYILADIVQSNTLSELIQKENHHVTSHTAPSLREIAFTLQTGREEFRYRYAFTAHTTETAATILEYLFEQPREHLINEISDSKSPSLTKGALSTIRSSRRNEKLRRLWLSGKVIHWQQLYKEQKTQRVHLPTYEFEKRQIWFDDRFETENAVKRDTKEEQLIDILSLFTKRSVTVYDLTKPLSQLGLDSLHLFELASRIKKQLNIALSIEEFHSAITANDILQKEKQCTENRQQEELPPTFFESLYSEAFASFEEYQIRSFHNSYGVLTEYLQCGSGKPLLFFNGLGMTFASIGNTIKELSKSRMVIVFNYPGVGKSEGLSGRYSFEQIEQITFDLLKELTLQKVDLIGWSMGGFIAQFFAERNSTRIETLTLINTAQHLQKEYTIENVHLMLDLVNKTYREQLANLPMQKIPLFEKLNMGTTSLRETFKAFEFAFTFNQSKRFFNFTHPTLIVTNRDDKIIPSNYSLQLKEHLTELGGKSYLKILPKGNHYIPMFNSEEFVKQFQAFHSQLSKEV